MKKITFVIGTDDTDFDPRSVDKALLNHFAGFTYYKAVGGWHSEGAPYVNGNIDDTDVMIEPAHVWDVVCQDDFPAIEQVKRDIAGAVSSYDIEAIMVVTQEVQTENFFVSDYNTASSPKQLVDNEVNNSVSPQQFADMVKVVDAALGDEIAEWISKTNQEEFFKRFSSLIGRGFLTTDPNFTQVIEVVHGEWNFLAENVYKEFQVYEPSRFGAASRSVNYVPLIDIIEFQRKAIPQRYVGIEEHYYNIYSLFLDFVAIHGVNTND